MADTSSIWAHSYDAVPASVFQVYSDMAEQIAGRSHRGHQSAGTSGARGRPDMSPEAYDLYLRAVDYLNRGNSPRTCTTGSAPRRAVLLDSSFAMAWGRLSEALSLSHWL